ncbi:phage tail protein, partial [Photorhabdus sp. P32]|uniref:phage tail fiber protein n=1 Tax=Photorhabdus sp. P32 TaxID=3117549 RepID=UPI00311B045A
KNLGLVETVNLAKSAVPSSRKINGKTLTGDVSLSAGDVRALPISSNLNVQTGTLRINNASNWPNLEFAATNGHIIGLEGTQGNRITIYANDAARKRRYTLITPEKGGTLATIDEVINTNGGVVGKNSYSTTDDFDKVPPNSTFFGYSEGLNGAGITGPGIKLSGGGGAFRGYDLMIQAAYYAGSSGLYFRSRNGDGAGRWNPWYSIWSTSNAKPDTNGFLKQSSPIVEIYPDGTFKTNDESKEATVKRLSEGVYFITGVLGFNADAAWGGGDGGIEIPLCKNKLPLIWIDYEVMQDGSIKLMTYHREHPDAPTFARNVREGYTDGNLIDIPQGRFISVRVQMPAIPDKLPTV